MHPDHFGHALTFFRVFLIELLTCGILTLFFLFYFNRLFATLISYGLRAYTWHKFRVYIDIQSLQISFLGGRIFFKGIRYHGKNETILVQNGYITWQYWLHAVKQVDVSRDKEPNRSTASSVRNSSNAESDVDGASTSDSVAEEGGIKAAGASQCRVSLNVTGLEWFVYNRSPAYDSIIKQKSQEDVVNRHSVSTGIDTAHGRQATSSLAKRGPVLDEKNFDMFSRQSSSKDEAFSTNEPSGSAEKRPGSAGLESPLSRSTIDHSPTSNADRDQTPLILRILPVWLECHRGAIVLGNETTKAILTSTFENAKGHIDASSSGPLDLYRQIFDFDIEHPVVQMRPNPDYSQTQRSVAERALFKFNSSQRKNHSIFNWHLNRRRRKAWNNLRNLVPYFRRSVESLHAGKSHEPAVYHGIDEVAEADDGRWLGLSRYLDDDENDDHAGWTNVEYAKFSTVLDCPSVHMNFHWDTPGKVPSDGRSAVNFPAADDINGADPPSYGLDLIIRGGNVDYGPWTDRLRIELQNAFFPNPYAHAQPAQRLEAGTERQYTVMRINVVVESEVSLRVPTRESSKDWQWKGRAGAMRGTKGLKKHREKRHFRLKRGEKSHLGPDIRPFGWMTFHVNANSQVTYVMDMIPRAEGYRNHLELSLTGTRASSSVNHALLWKCGQQRLSCDLSAPLNWNDLHKWTFSIHSQSMELFMLRDHMFLLTDLISDFTAGPSTDYMTFVPFHYTIDLSFDDLKLYLNSNDSNIIDNPTDREENAFLLLGMESLNGRVDIPLENFSPKQSNVLFKADGRNLRMELLTPTWSTLHTFVSDRPVASLKHLDLDGYYNYHPETSPKLTDILKLNIGGTALRLYLHGFLIKYFMKMKDNYFGEFLHFKTLEEFQDNLASGNVFAANHHSHTKQDNDLDVILNVKADRSCALLPANLYSRKENVRLDILLAEADMRFTNYYMDIEASSSPIEASIETLDDEKSNAPGVVSNTQLFIDGVSVYGHRLFGAPPTEPAYVCNWDIGVGSILGECSSDFVRILAFAGRSFDFALDDDENTIPLSLTTTIHDITFLRARVESMSIWLLVDEAAVLLQTASVDVAFNDWAGVYFSQRVHAEIPSIVVAAIDRNDAARHRSASDEPVTTYAYIETSVDLRLIARKENFAKDRALQQAHVRFHDMRTNRAQWLLHDPDTGKEARLRARARQEPPAMPVPFMPEPVTDTSPTPAPYSSVHQQRQSSFLSLPSSHRMHPPKPVQKAGTRIKNDRIRSESTRRRVPGAFGVGRIQREVDCTSRDTPGASFTFASPWSAPYFSLQNIKLDRAEVPRYDMGAEEMLQPEADDAAFMTTTEASKTAHASLLVDIRRGVMGFCTPHTFKVVSVLLGHVQPRHPVDLMDGLQIGTMSKILKLSKLRSKDRQTDDVRIQLPVLHLKLLDSRYAAEEKQLPRTGDQYDLVVSRTRLTVRISDFLKAQDGEGGNEATLARGQLMHMQMAEAYAMIAERADQDGICTPSGQLVLEDVGCWLAIQEQNTVKLQLRNVQASTWSKQVEHLVSLIQRINYLSDQIKANIKVNDQSQMLQHLVYHLTLQGAHISDPIFLTKPSYVLRSAGDHLRQNDSWKAVSRLRSMYASLPSEIQCHIIQEAHGGHVEVPEDAAQHVMANFDQWRNWDHGQMQDSFLMETIWGKAAAVPAQNHAAPLRFECVVGSMRLALDPGPIQNDLSVVGLDVALSVATTALNSGIDSNTKSQLQTWTVQTYCSRIGLSLNWNLVDLFRKSVQLISLNMNQTSVSKPVVTDGPGDMRLMLQIVVGTDLAAITIDTPNASLTMAAEKLMTSAIRDLALQDVENVSVMVSASSALAKVTSDEISLLSWKLLLPVVNVSQRTFHNQKAEIDIKIVGICHRIRFALKQDIVSLLAVVNRVINDEVRTVNDIVSTFNSNASRSSTPQNRSIDQNPKLSVALFLDDYTLSFEVLPALFYIISGQVARMSVRPRQTSDMQIDLDLKHHSHRFHVVDTVAIESASKLTIPPINGRVSLQNRDSVLTLNVEATLEQIALEAKAVRSWLDALAKPEISQLVKDAKAGVNSISTKVKSIFDTEEVKVTEKSEKPEKDDAQIVRYAARLTMQGLVVHCSAPGMKSDAHRADLKLYAGLATAHVHNIVEQSTSIHKRPQLDLALRKIGLELGRRDSSGLQNFGKLDFAVHITAKTETDDQGNNLHAYKGSSGALTIDLHEQAALLVVDVAAFLQERIKSLVIPGEVKNTRSLRRLTVAGLTERHLMEDAVNNANEPNDDSESGVVFGSTFALNLSAIQVRWLANDYISSSPSREAEDLVFSIRKIDLGTQREGSARLSLTDLQLQMVAKSSSTTERSANSALMPEVVFNVAHLATKHDRRFAFQAAGKALDLRLASDFILPASALQDSLASASKQLREASALWTPDASSSPQPRVNFLGSKNLASLLVDADFAGAVVNIQTRQQEEPRNSVFGILKGSKRSRGGRYGQAVQGQAASEANLRAPGVAFKIEYRDPPREDPSLSAEIKVAASSNVLYPSVVPLIIEVSSSITEIVGDSDQAPSVVAEKPQAQKSLAESTLNNTDPATILGRCRLNVGLWIDKQEFSLSCQPIARVAATARFESIFLTVNTVQSVPDQRFFAILLSFNKFQAAVQHVYSRESTASFDVDSIVASLMNSKHVTANTGLSAILNISPMSTAINVKQLQDFLLFREIWYPAELRRPAAGPSNTPKVTKVTDTQAYVVQRYQQVAAAGAFPWNAVVSVQELKVQVDLGQGLGKSLFTISKLWANSKKTSDWEQNLCLGFDKVGIDSTGRMSGFIELQNFRVRTSIRWPLMDKNFQQTPLVQASLGLDELRVKASFDYQPFAIADISTLEFLMYNVRPTQKGDKDRLVALLDGDKVQVFCTTSTASQGLALFQAIQRLIQEKEADYEASLRELDRYLRRKSVFPSNTWTEATTDTDADEEDNLHSSVSLHTDVVVTLKAVNIGAFPSTFFDNQILKVEATDAEARFAVATREGKTNSGLGLMLGQLRVALAQVNRSNTQALGEVSVSEIINRATGSRGGTILKVPKVKVEMQTFQAVASNVIEYLFKSTFEGKIDVGWNYQRISFIRGMWSEHARALAHRLGKPLPQSAVKITGGPQPHDPTGQNQGQEKITAVVNVPQSKFQYVALEPPIIDTPQLKDLGDATPKLEWIGLDRGKLPNVTHQIIIVTLLELAKEVDDAYGRILGSS